MKTLKKVTSLIICLALVLSFLPQVTLFASAAEEVIVSSDELDYNNNDVILSFGRTAMKNTLWKPDYTTAESQEYDDKGWRFHSTNAGSPDNNGVGRLEIFRTNYMARVSTNSAPVWLATVAKYPAPGKYTVTFDYYNFEYGASQIAVWMLPADTTNVEDAISKTAPTNIVEIDRAAYAGNINSATIINAPIANITVTPDLADTEVMFVIKGIVRGNFETLHGAGYYGIDWQSITFNGSELPVPELAQPQIRAAMVEANVEEDENGKINISNGETVQLTATAEMSYTVDGNYAVPMDKTEVTWSTSDKNVATVENGLVTWVSEGEAKITADVTLDGITQSADAIVVCTPSIITDTTIVNSGTCGDNLTWTLDSDGLLTISGTGAMYDYYYEYDGVEDWVMWEDLPGWYYLNKPIYSVVIEIGITSIDDFAFFGCNDITDIYYDGTQAQWETISAELWLDSDITIHFAGGATSEETVAYAEETKAEIVAIKDGSSEASALIDEIATRIDAIAKNVSLTVDEAKAQIDALKKEAEMKCGVLNLRFQITNGTTTGSTKSDIRFISTVDSLKDYKETGFYITINGIKKRIATKNVYSSLVGKTGAVITNYAPSDIFSKSKYFSTYSIWDIPNSAFSSPITVQAFVLLKDGTEILGVEKTRTVKNFIVSYN